MCDHVPSITTKYLHYREKKKRGNPVNERGKVKKESTETEQSLKVGITENDAENVTIFHIPISSHKVD